MHNTSLHTNTNTHSYTNITLATPVLSAALNCNFSVCNTTSLAAPIKITFEHEEVEVNALCGVLDYPCFSLQHPYVGSGYSYAG